MRVLILLLVLTGCANIDRVSVIQTEIGGLLGMVRGKATACSLRKTEGIDLTVTKMVFNPKTGVCDIEFISP